MREGTQRKAGRGDIYSYVKTKIKIKKDNEKFGQIVIHIFNISFRRSNPIF